jgi:hypothetical protein
VFAPDSNLYFANASGITRLNPATGTATLVTPATTIAASSGTSDNTISNMGMVINGTSSSNSKLLVTATLTYCLYNNCSGSSAHVIEAIPVGQTTPTLVDSTAPAAATNYIADNGYLYAASSTQVFQINTTTWVTTTVTGQPGTTTSLNGPASSATFAAISGLGMTPDGSALWVGDGNLLRQISTNTPAVAGQGTSGTGTPIAPGNVMLTADTAGGSPSGKSTCSCKSSTQPAVAKPVNIASGDFYDTKTVQTAPGPGAPLALSATYSSQVAQRQLAAGQSSGALGYGWSTNLLSFRY